MEGVNEELEAVQSVFSEEVSVTELEDGTKLVEYRVGKEPVLTLQLNSSYPASVPALIFPDHLKSVGLSEHLQASVRDLAGCPMLFQLFTSTREWMDGHPLAIPAAALPHSNHSPPRGNASSQNVCKFFVKGTCKFGSKCKNYHPDPKLRPSAQPEGEANKVGMACEGGKKLPQAPQESKFEVEKTSERGSKREEGKKQSMRTATDVISRILWDPDIKTEQFTVGYLDRFIGIIEKPFSAFSWEDISSVGANVLAVPKHRIQYFKYRQEVVWDKAAQLDNVFGSRGGKLIQDVIAASRDNVTPPPSKQASGATQDEGTTRASRTYPQEERPTHFVCVRVTGEEVLAKARDIQSQVLLHSPHLSQGCLPPSALHVTVCMVRLETDSHLETARRVLDEARTHLAQLLPSCVELAFTGVDNFRDRLIYAKVAPDGGLDRLSSLLIEHFGQAGLKTPGNHAHFTPHMTLVKMSRPMQQESGTSVISREAYARFADTSVGKDRVSGIHLCSMTEPRQEDGFYKRLHFCPNSLASLSPLLPQLISKCVRHLCHSHALSERESGDLLRAIGQPDAEGFDSAVEAVREVLQREGSNPLAARLVILRGLPGSGKSFLASRCSEAGREGTVVCSADNYFIRSDGQYEFRQCSLAEAHAQCCERFLQALREDKQLIVLDNTNSTLWEYRVYLHVCQSLGLQWHLLEIPHPTQHLVDACQARNLHQVGMASMEGYVQRWEEDKRAMLVPPNLVYPRPRATTTTTTDLAPPTFSLLELCRPGYLPEELLATPSPGASGSLVVVYSGVFLTPKSQWKLVSCYPPTRARVHAHHVTLRFAPSDEQILQGTPVGKKVSVTTVGGVAEDAHVQAVGVTLPEGLSSDNLCPHITLSTDQDHTPNLANTMLESLHAPPLSSSSSSSHQLKLSGVVGVAVREATSTGGKLYIVLSGKHFKEQVLPRLTTASLPAAATPPPVPHPLAEEGLSPPRPPMESGHPATDATTTSASILTGHVQPITELCVFDFDMTLFDTPDVVEGRRLYQQVTGRAWPHRGFLSRPESMLPPLRVRPGPALAEFRARLGRAGTHMVVLTARITHTRPGVLTVLEDHQACPDQLLLKPPDTRQGTPEFKVHTLATLLEQFPDVGVVRFWDDRENNLEAVRTFSRQRKNRKIQFHVTDSTRPLSPPEPRLGEGVSGSVLGSYLASCGLVPTRERLTAAEAGLSFLAAQFAAVVGFHGQDPLALARVFGSHPLGRLSDVDLCLLAPPGLTHSDCMERLAGQLERCGVTHLHKGYSSRCPRLKLMLHFKESPSIDYDVVFAICPSPESFARMTATVDPDTPEILTDFDPLSQTALSGVALTRKVREVIGGAVSAGVFAAVVEMAVQVLRAQREKGNFYHYFRTFHLVLLLLDSVKKAESSIVRGVDCDTLFELFVTHVAGLTPREWEGVFEEYVPVLPEYVPRQSPVFHTLSEILERRRKEEVPLTDCYQEMLSRPAFPPEHHVPVWLVCEAEGGRGDDDTTPLLWRLRTLLEAKLPTLVRHLHSAGLEVALDGNGVLRSGFCFAVRDSPSTRNTVQQVFRKFWNEFSEYRNRKEVRLELRFSRRGGELEGLGGTAAVAGDQVVKRVEEFALGELKELHLPPTLTSYERLLVHEMAEQLGLSHKSVGQEDKRHVYLYKS